MTILSWFKRHFTCSDCGSWNTTMQGGCLTEGCLNYVGGYWGPPKVKPAPVETRKRLPNRRISMRETITFVFSGATERQFEVTFGFDDQGAIRELFCEGNHTHSDLQGIVHDGCIAASMALQHGARIADLAKAFSELRPEGAENGPPASPLGAIARAGVALEAEAGPEIAAVYAKAGGSA